MNYLIMALGALLILIGILNIFRPDRSSNSKGLSDNTYRFTKLDLIFPIDSLIIWLLGPFVKLFFSSVGLILIGIGLVILGIRM